MTTSRNNTIMSWMAYTDFLSRLRIAAGILLPLNTRTLLLYPGGRDCIGAAGVDAYSGTPIRSVCGILCGQRKSAKLHRFQKLQKSKENTRNPKISGAVLELLGGFEPPTSSLPRMRSTY